MAKKINEIKWLDKPEDHDYPAAESYLRLIYSDEKAKHLALELEKAPMTKFKAKDVVRASMQPLLPMSNSHIKKNIKKIIKGKKLSPILLVRDPINGKVIIVDGFHRICAIYKSFNNTLEDLWIPCKIT